MRKQKIVPLIFGFAILGTALLMLSFAVAPEHEPRAHGYRLSFWVEREYGWVYPLTPAAEREEAEIAIQEIGTNALPFLLKWMEYQPPRWKLIVMDTASKLPGWVPGRKRLLTDAATLRAKAAPQVFKALGAIAAPAVPELEVRAQDTNSSIRSGYALLSLCNIGQVAVPSIAKALSNPRLAQDPRIATQIGDLGTNGLPLIDPLLQYLNHTNADTVLLSIRVLSYLRLEPDMVVPALTQKLSDPRPVVRDHVLTALPHFGSFAASALPQLTNMLSDTNSGIRHNATNAIAIITANVRPR